MIAQVALPLPINRLFSYQLPPRLVLYAKPLTRVKVSFGNRSLVGFIVAVSEGEEEGLKPVEELVDLVPLVDDTCFRLCTWASQYYLAPLGLALKYALSSVINMERYCVVRTEDSTLSHLDNIKLRKACTVAGKEAILEYLNLSAIRLHDVFTGRSLAGKESPGPAETEAGARLYAGGVEARREFYSALISRELRRDRNVLMLVPDYHEVGAYFYRFFLERFPGAVFWYGSTIPAKQKAEAYFRARLEGGRLILGNKSCPFLPSPATGLVIVERPEEDEYRNEEAFKFNAVQLAMKRAEIEAVPVVLGSVAPPLEVMRWASEGRVGMVEAPPVRCPAIAVVKHEKSGGREAELSDGLIGLIRETISQGKNVVVHAPRRAYAAHLYCLLCRRPFLCPLCASALGYNREDETLSCGNCKGVFPYEEKCVQCGSNLIRFFETGAEYLEHHLKELFPGVTVTRVTGETVRRPEIDGLMGQGGAEGSILIGTHVLSKLYGIRAGHLVLYGWEDFSRTAGYRAREKMFQVFRNLVDAVNPEKISLYSRGKEPVDVSLFPDEKRFYADELQKRRMAEFPPYVRLFVVNVVKRNEKNGKRVIDRIEALVARQNLGEHVLGQRELKGHYGWRLVLKGDEQTLSGLLSSLYRLPGVHAEADPLYL